MLYMTMPKLSNNRVKCYCTFGGMHESLINLARKYMKWLKKGKKTYNKENITRVVRVFWTHCQEDIVTLSSQDCANRIICVHPRLCGVHVAQSLVVLCSVDHCLAFCPFSFCNCIVCPSIYGFWLHLRYLSDSMNDISHGRQDTPLYSVYKDHGQTMK